MLYYSIKKTQRKQKENKELWRRLWREEELPWLPNVVGNNVEALYPRHIHTHRRKNKKKNLFYSFTLSGDSFKAIQGFCYYSNPFRRILFFFTWYLIFSPMRFTCNLVAKFCGKKAENIKCLCLSFFFCSCVITVHLLIKCKKKNPLFH